jgi:LemA protein
MLTTIILVIFFMIVMVVFVYFIAIYNTIVKHKNDIDKAFASIDVMLKKRHELIPNLVNAVKEYMNYEKNTLQEIVELRNSANNKDLPSGQMLMIENAITQSLGNILVKVEDYPDLKASENFLQLQQALNEVEEHLSASRRFYNAAVTQYNNSIQVFPNNMIAPRFGFAKRPVFESNHNERQTVDINQKFNSL